MRETIRKKLMKPRGKTYVRCALITKNVDGGGGGGGAGVAPPPPPRAD